MKGSETKNLSIEELSDRIISAAQDLENLRFAHAVTPLENPMRIGMLKRDLSRLKTELQAKIITDVKAKAIEGSLHSGNINEFVRNAQYPEPVKAAKVKRYIAQTQKTK